MKYTKEKFKFMNNLPVISLMGLSRKSEIANYILELREENHKIGSMDLFNDIASHSFVNVLESLRRKYKDELDNWNDKTDEYNS
jgi:hypothetical protein